MSGTVLTPADSPTPPAAAPVPWDLRIAAERLALVAQTVDWDLPQDAGGPLQGQPLRDWCAARHDRISQHITELGLGLWLAKRELGHGAWLGWLKEVGISQQRANEAIALARLLFGAPPAAVPTLTHLPQRKLLALSSGGQQLLEALVQDGTLAEVPAMSRDDIRALVRERTETAALRARLDEVCAERDQAQAATQRMAALPPANRQLAALRLAVLEEVERLRATGLALQRVVAELAAFPPGLDDPGLDAACHTTVYALEGLLGLVQSNLTTGYTLREHYTPGLRMPPPLLSEEEQRRARDWSGRFLAEADLRHGARQVSALDPPAPRRRKP